MRVLLLFVFLVAAWCIRASSRGRSVPTLPLVALSTLVAASYFFLSSY